MTSHICVLAQMLNPQREDGRVLNGHKGAAQGQGQQTDVAAAEGGEQESSMAINA